MKAAIWASVITAALIVVVIGLIVLLNNSGAGKIEQLEMRMAEVTSEREEISQLREEVDILIKDREAVKAQWSRVGSYAYVASRYYAETTIASLKPDETDEAYARVEANMTLDPLLVKAWDALGSGDLPRELFETILLERVFSELWTAITIQAGDTEGRLQLP